MTAVDKVDRNPAIFTFENVLTVPVKMVEPRTFKYVPAVMADIEEIAKRVKIVLAMIS